MTKLFETQDDLDNEREAVMALAAYTQSIPYKMPMQSQIDFIMVRDGEAKAAVEIKCRKTPSQKYDKYLLSNKKYDALCAWAEFGLTSILLIKWSDAIGFVKVPIAHEKTIGGRYDRGPTIGVEPVVLIDIYRFRFID